MKLQIFSGFLILLISFLSSCSTNNGSGSNLVRGSDPINAKEARAYPGAINRCIKTGGTRVVKIEGRLRCF